MNFILKLIIRRIRFVYRRSYIVINYIKYSIKTLKSKDKSKEKNIIIIIKNYITTNKVLAISLGE